MSTRTIRTISVLSALLFLGAAFGEKSAMAIYPFPAAAGSFQAIKPTDAQWIVRDYTGAAGALYNSDPNNTRQVVTGLSAVNNGSIYTYTVHGVNAGLPQLCAVYAINLATGVVVAIGGSTTANGLYSYTLTLNLATAPGGA